VTRKKEEKDLFFLIEKKREKSTEIQQITKGNSIILPPHKASVLMIRF